jgi:phage protein D
MEAPPIQHHLSLFFIKIGDSTASEKSMAHAPAELMDAIDEIIVDTSLHQPDMVTIRVHDRDRKWVNDRQLFGFGKKLIIEVVPQGQPTTKRTKLIEAEITGLEAEFVAGGITKFLVRGYHRSNRLHLGTHSRTFTNRTDSDIVRSIAQEIGLSAEMDETDVEYEYVLQNNQTNWEFLAVRAERIGYQIYAVDSKLYFKKVSTKSQQAPVPLTLGEDLRQFRPRMSVMHQSNKVKVYGWDAKGKQGFVGNAAPDGALNQGGMQATGGAEAQKAFEKPPQRFVTASPVASTSDANALAKGLAADIDRDFLEADGTCYGHPDVKAGNRIKLDGLGQRFDGEYFVTAATHLYNGSGYEVEFTVSGRHPPTLYHLLNGTNQTATGRQIGLVVGLVTNVNDPEKLGRVKVKFPWLFDDTDLEIESTWTRLSTPMAGQDGKGIFTVPEVDDEVLVAFEHGDVNRPYIMGVVWNNKDRPPKPHEGELIKNGKVVKRIMRSRLGHEVEFDDSEDKPSVIVSTNGGHKIRLIDTSSEPKVEIITNSGHKVVMDDSPGKESILLSDKTGGNTMKIDSTTNSIALKSTADLRLEAGGRIVLVGQTGIALSAPAGGSFEADGPLTVKSSAILTLQGSVVKIN